LGNNTPRPKENSRFTIKVVRFSSNVVYLIDETSQSYTHRVTIVSATLPFVINFWATVNCRPFDQAKATRAGGRRRTARGGAGQPEDGTRRREQPGTGSGRHGQRAATPRGDAEPVAGGPGLRAGRPGPSAAARHRAPLP